MIPVRESEIMLPKELAWRPSPVDSLERLLTIRIVEDWLQGLCDQGLAGDLHFSKGQEAISVGVCAALHPEDKIVTHHRTIAHEIAKGATLYPLLAEVLGKRTGLNKGRAGEMHLHNNAIGHAFSFQLVGTCLPVAAGLAWAERFYKQTEHVVVCFLGDAAFSNGAVHEGLNIAAVQRCPLLVVVEDNQIAGNIQPMFYRPLSGAPAPSWKDRFKAYGIDSELLGGNDVEEIEHVARQAADYVRARSLPFGLVLQTQRLCWHKQGQRDYRLATEIANLARFDPIRVAQRRLAKSDTDLETRRGWISSRLQPIFDQVLADPPAEMHYDD